MRFSLVTPTMDRNEDLFKLLATLQEQTYQDFEVIIVDLNKNDLLLNYNFSAYTFPVIVTRPGRRLNASEARNYGFQLVKGELISFPDDDCWYESNILERVNDLFHKKNVDLITMGASDPIKGKRIHKFLSKSRLLNSSFDIPKAGIEYSMFIRKEAFASLRGFDTTISPGSDSMFQAGEAMDLLFRSLLSSQKIYFDNSLFIYHPYKLDFDSVLGKNAKIAFDKHFKYAAAFGYVMVKNKQFLPFLYYFLRSVAAFGLSIVRFNATKRKLEWYNLKGRLVGYIKGYHIHNRYPSM